MSLFLLSFSIFLLAITAIKLKHRTRKLQKKLFLLEVEQEFQYAYLLDLINDLFALITPQTNSIQFYTEINGVLTKVKHMNVKVTQKFKMTINISDRAGNPAKVDGVPAWSLTDAALGSLAVADDGMSAEFTPAGTVGDLQIQVNADADLDPGITKTILGTLDVSVIGGDAELISITAEAPTDI